MASTPSSSAFPPVGYRYFHIVATIFVATLLISNTLAFKILAIFQLMPSASIIVFPISFLAGDVLTEVYGFRRTQSLIWWGFFCMAGMSLFYWITSLLPPALCFETQNPAFIKFFGFAPRIGLASFIAYITGEFLNSMILSYLKVKMQSNHFWLRAMASTIVGQSADTLIFTFIAFSGIFPITTLVFMLLSSLILKICYQVIALPFTCMFVRWLKHAEGVDAYDQGVIYNPFHLSL